MRKLLLVFLILLVSCANPLYTQDAKLYEKSIDYKGIVVEDTWDLRIDEQTYMIFSHDALRTSTKLKNTVVDRIKDYDFLKKVGTLSSVKFAKAIISKNVDKDTGALRSVAGMYSSASGVIYVTVYADGTDEELELVFCHELGHALWYGMTDDQKTDWYLLYQERLDNIGLEDPLRMNYRKASLTQIAGMPSSYCLYSCSEYFAECFMFYNTDVYKLRFGFKDEEQLLLKHILEMREKYDGESHNR